MVFLFFDFSYVYSILLSSRAQKIWDSHMNGLFHAQVRGRSWRSDLNRFCILQNLNGIIYINISASSGNTGIAHHQWCCAARLYHSITVEQWEFSNLIFFEFCSFSGLLLTYLWLKSNKRTIWIASPYNSDRSRLHTNTARQQSNLFLTPKSDVSLLLRLCHRWAVFISYITFIFVVEVALFVRLLAAPMLAAPMSFLCLIKLGVI
jgi:hypothetical protein